MTLLDIINAYSNLQAIYGNVDSTFDVCSMYGKPKRCFVTNHTKCINFDNVKNDFNPNLKSVDSLYFSHRDNAVYFIEFKNSHYDNVHEDIVEKANDSILVHHQACQFPSYFSVDNIIVCVLSENKTMSHTNNLLSSYLKLSGYTTNASYLSFLESKFAQSFFAFVGTTRLPFMYNTFKIVFDTSFDSFVISI